MISSANASTMTMVGSVIAISHSLMADYSGRQRALPLQQVATTNRAMAFFIGSEPRHVVASGTVAAQQRSFLALPVVFEQANAHIASGSRLRDVLSAFRHAVFGGRIGELRLRRIAVAAAAAKTEEHCGHEHFHLGKRNVQTNRTPHPCGPLSGLSAQ